MKLYKAPIYLACSLHDNIHEVVRARTLLNKVATFDMATPTDLNVIINQTYNLAKMRDEDLAEIGSHFYSRMMTKISKIEEDIEKENISAKKRIRMKDPSHEVFSEYLRRVYTFGCW